MGPRWDVQNSLERVRAVWLALPEVSERLSHGAPTFFVRAKRSFVMYLDDHHGDGRLAIWCPAPLGFQDQLVESAPQRYFVPPYVGHRGWVGLRLDRDAAWSEVEAVIEDAYRAVAPARLAEARWPRPHATPPER
jgi:hypothetical protein